MDQETWTRVDDWFAERLLPADPTLAAAMAASDAAGMPAHHVAPNQGKLLQLLAQMCGARRILEIGTLAGYSTIWLARALPANGLLISLESNPQHAAVAQANLQRAGQANNVKILIAPALHSLEQMREEAAFDLIFIDADKPNNPAYLQHALRLSRPGTVIIGDNVVRNGAVTDADSSDANVQGVRGFFDLLHNEPRIDATALQTVGCKG